MTTLPNTALIVSVEENFDLRLPNLGSAVFQDADAVASVLKSPLSANYDPSKVHRISGADATADAIEHAIMEFGEHLTPNDPFLFYYSGHGGHSEGEICLEPIDSNLTANTNRLTASRLSKAFSTIPSRRKLLLIDACYAGGLGQMVGTMKSTQSLYQPLATGEGVVVIASSDRTQPSAILRGDKLSLFTKHLVAGLQGGAALDGAKHIGVFDIFNYISEAVVAEYPDQHPVYAANSQKSNFAIALAPKSLAYNTSKTKFLNQDTHTVAFEVFQRLYPMGPSDREVWERAGGALGVLDLSGPGQTQWFRALRLIENGGLPALNSLRGVALEDYPFNQKLISIPDLKI